LGAIVTAVDCSELAIQHARDLRNSSQIEWVQADIRTLTWPAAHFDIVVAYGVFHCLESQQEVFDLIDRLQTATRPGGSHIVCALNERFQDIERAHPDFEPCLLNHDQYLRLYDGWTIVRASDEDLVETHPHNMIEHTHSLTRFCAKRKNDPGLPAGT
jgi:2-polyprenyl-3-methyl-5-hydroxy-6-metoxy-1,4-benzoquinol methylase